MRTAMQIREPLYAIVCQLIHGTAGTALQRDDVLACAGKNRWFLCDSDILLL